MDEIDAIVFRSQAFLIVAMPQICIVPDTNVLLSGCKRKLPCYR
ncbi:MAG: hypothetical protein PHD43_07970 [Methylococcales bacterium]|nr:hypothetical protein [Methylococcales bacterium]